MTPKQARFTGIDAKLARVHALSQEFAALEANFVERAEATCRRTQRFSADGLRCVLSVECDLETPVEFAVRAGEIVHHLRSALDYVVVSMALANDADAKLSHKFPITKGSKEFDRALTSGALDGLTSGQIETIRSRQPWNQPEIEHHPLRLIAELDNQDKHRLLIVAAAAATLDEKITILHDEAMASALGVRSDTQITNFEVHRGELRASPTDYFTMHLAKPDPTVLLDAPVKIELSLPTMGSHVRPPAGPLLAWLHQSVIATLNAFRPLAPPPSPSSRPTGNCSHPASR